MLTVVTLVTCITMLLIALPDRIIQLVTFCWTSVFENAHFTTSTQLLGGIYKQYVSRVCDSLLRLMYAVVSCLVSVTMCVLYMTFHLVHPYIKPSLIKYINATKGWWMPVRGAVINMISSTFMEYMTNQKTCTVGEDEVTEAQIDGKTLRIKYKLNGIVYLYIAKYNRRAKRNIRYWTVTGDERTYLEYHPGAVPDVTAADLRVDSICKETVSVA